MTFPADQPVVSGQSYTVTAVDGHRPAALTDFVGTIAVTLVRTTRTSGSGPSPPAAAARSSLRPAAARSSLRPPQLSNHIELGGGRCAAHARVVVPGRMVPKRPHNAVTSLLRGWWCEAMCQGVDTRVASRRRGRGSWWSGRLRCRRGRSMRCEHLEGAATGGGWWRASVLRRWMTL